MGIFILFIFFVLPLATILLSIVLQKLLRSPILVGITFFAIYLIVSFVAFSNNLAEALIATIIYTIIAIITAYITRLICRCWHLICNFGNQNNTNDTTNNSVTTSTIAENLIEGDTTDNTIQTIENNSNNNCYSRRFYRRR